MNELEIKKNSELINASDVEFIRQFDELNKRYKVWVDSHKEMFEKFLEDNNLESYEQDGVRIYKTKPYRKKQIDTKALKEQGIYDNFVNEVWVKGSLRIQVDYDDEHD